MSYIKLDRKLVDWEWFDDAVMVKVWLYILLNVNYEDKKWHGQDVPKGSFITSREHMAKSLNISEQTLRTCLNKLKSTNEITIKSTNKFTQIYATKWDEFQCCNNETNQQINQQTNQQLTSNQPATNQQLTTTKKYKEYKEIKEGKKYINTFRNGNLLQIEIKPDYTKIQNNDVGLDEVEKFLKERGQTYES